MELLDHRELEMCLAIASRMIEKGQLFRAEWLYKLILVQAEEIEEEGPRTGIVLLDLHALYEKQGRKDEAAPIWERIRRILIRGFLQNGATEGFSS